MNANQRIVGAIVLVALAVIFIPMLLEQPHQRPQTGPQAIPPRPALPAYTIEAPVRPVVPRAGSLEHEATAAEGGVATTGRLPRPAGENAEAGRPAEQSAPGGVANGADLAKKAAGVSKAAMPGAPASAREPPAKQIESSGEVEKQGADYTLDAARQPVAWAIQIGTFSNRERAHEIRDALISSDLGGFVQEHRPEGGGVLLRVLAGPFLERAIAERRKAELDQQYKVDSLVVRYRPDE